jgi:hypothetical protein
MPHIFREDLIKKLDHALTVVSIGEIWKHTKTGGHYVIVGIGINEKT